MGAALKNNNMGFGFATTKKYGGTKYKTCKNRHFVGFFWSTFSVHRKKALYGPLLGLFWVYFGFGGTFPGLSVGQPCTFGAKRRSLSHRLTPMLSRSAVTHKTAAYSALKCGVFGTGGGIIQGLQ